MRNADRNIALEFIDKQKKKNHIASPISESGSRMRVYNPYLILCNYIDWRILFSKRELQSTAAEVYVCHLLIFPD